MVQVNFVKIAWAGKHFGEEPPLVGKTGSGAIFFTGCNLRCVYCQNYQISQQNMGRDWSIEELARAMIKLQKEGALNINLVSPTIWAEQIKQAIKKVKKKGLKIPVVWNSNAYESVKLIKNLKGLVDIYLPDFKYGDDALAFKYSGAKNYRELAKETIKEMFLQAGNLKLSKEGIAQKGIIVRHLILPNNIENSKKVLDCVREINKDIFISLMSQYEPLNKAKDFPEIARRITREEFERVYDYQIGLGLKNGWVQEIGSQNVFLPDFKKENPFI
ncbi:MAG: radical SAM protein [Candidatus Nealsonbacteria bacterium]|nr:radical SAM protein [Candidatus Nealsonbacteria bacterium]